jgi:hypothetical protein
MMRAKGSVVGTGARVSRARSTKDFDDRGRNFRLRRQFGSIRGETGPDDARRGVGRGRWMSCISREVDAPVRGVVKCVHECCAGCAVRSRASKSDTGGLREPFFGAFSRDYFVFECGLVNRRVSCTAEFRRRFGARKPTVPGRVRQVLARAGRARLLGGLWVRCRSAHPRTQDGRPPQTHPHGASRRARGASRVLGAR